uniref:Uncharacterized protein n=1 Tax=Wuchereria bancrofti TaxID=6293 RepID=A0A1I8ENT4_WUCBA
METDELVVDGPTVRKLCDWINMWKERLRKSRNNKKDVVVPSRRKKRDSDSFDSAIVQYCYHIWPLCAGNGILILINVFLWVIMDFTLDKLSRRYKMHVLEIASNEKRNGLQLKCKLQGDTHSRKVLIKKICSCS